MPDDPAAQLRRLARDVEKAGKKIQQEIPGRMRKVAAPLIGEIRAETRILPYEGGFRSQIRDSRITVRTLTGTHNAGVVIVGVRTKTGGTVDLRSVDRGKLRHQVFGNRDRWVNQTIPSGFWTRPVRAHRQAVVTAMVALMEEIRQDIERG